MYSYDSAARESVPQLCEAHTTTRTGSKVDSEVRLRNAGEFAAALDKGIINWNKELIGTPL